jgi:ureidoglycolate hydrolase
LNRHDTHTQTLMPMTADAYVVVAPAVIDFSAVAHLETVRAFRLSQHAVVHLARGTWHWGPYPIGADELSIFNIHGRGYANDNAIAYLARDLHTAFAVVPA